MPQVICKRCQKTCKNLQGWKSHNTSKHGGYTDAELAEAAGIKPQTAPENLKSHMDQVADELKTDDSLPIPADYSTSYPAPPPPAELPPPPPEEKRVKATPKKLKKILGDIPSAILKSGGIELDSDDDDAMEEAGEFLTEVFGFEFAVPEKKFVIHNRFAALVWVLGIVGIIYVKHRAPKIWKTLFRPDKKDDKKDNKTSVPVDPASPEGQESR